MALEPSEVQILLDMKEHMGSMNGRLLAIETAVQDKTRCGDHGRRLRTLESAEDRRIGLFSMIALIAGAIASFFTRKFGG
jgi:hypothetical protein